VPRIVQSGRARFVVVPANEDNPTASDDTGSEGRQPDGLPRGKTRGGVIDECLVCRFSPLLLLYVLLLLAEGRLLVHRLLHVLLLLLAQ
jgi:hypothetical protein